MRPEETHGRATAEQAPSSQMPSDEPTEIEASDPPRHTKVIFVSDVHLDPEHRPEVYDLFIRFLGNEAREARALYILGDLFDSWWIGDEYDRDRYPEVLAALRELTDSGVPVYVLPGNRDFLLGELFASDSGASILTEPCIVRVFREPILIAHGDVYCTDDHHYQRLRKLTHNTTIRWIWEHMPLEWKIRIGNSIRNASADAVKQKPDDIMDVNAVAIEDAIRRSYVMKMVHGHTHRPGEHTWKIDGHNVYRYVLGDWYEQGSMLVADENGDWSLQKLDLEGSTSSELEENIDSFTNNPAA